MVLLLVLACASSPPSGGPHRTTVATSTSTTTTQSPVDTGSGAWTDDWGPPANGGLRIASGLALTEIAWVPGPGPDCGQEQPVLLDDRTGDGVPEVVVSCENPVASDLDVELHVVNGGAALAERWTGLVHLDSWWHGAGGLGDVDSDGFWDIGFGNAPRPSGSGTDRTWWWIRWGSTLSDGDARSWATDLQGAGDKEGYLPPLPLGDLDGDGRADLLTCQIGHDGSSIHVVSGAEIPASGSVDVRDIALRELIGMPLGVRVSDATSTSDLDGDGVREVAVGIDHLPPEVVVSWGADLAGPTDSLRIVGAARGNNRTVEVEALGDLDGDGLDELAVLLSTENHAELAVIPGSVLAQRTDVQAADFALGGVDVRRHALEACDLDGDGLPELIVEGWEEGATWDGRDLLTPGARPIGGDPGGLPLCAGDLDGLPGSELVVGQPYRNQ